MKKGFLFIIAVIFTLAIFSCSRFYNYAPARTFISPLPVKLEIRNDDYGDGHFGAKRSGGRRHNGVDFLAAVGTPVFAVKSGIVEKARYRKGNGKYVRIRHAYGFQSYYCHLSEILTREGRRVRQGQAIGYVGKTGNANIKGMKAHLHFELHKNDAPINPLKEIISEII